MEIFFLVLFLAAPVFSARITECQVPKYKEPIDWNRGKVSELKLKIQFPRDKVRIESQSDTDIVNFSVNDTIIMMEGLYTENNSMKPPQIINASLIVQYEGYGKLVNKTDQSIAKMKNCGQTDTKFWENNVLFAMLYLTIFPYINNCVSSKMCRKFGSVRYKGLIDSNNSDELGNIQANTHSEDQTNTINSLNQYRREEIKRTMKEAEIMEEQKKLNKTKDPDFLTLMLNDTMIKDKEHVITNDTLNFVTKM